MMIPIRSHCLPSRRLIRRAFAHARTARAVLFVAIAVIGWPIAAAELTGRLTLVEDGEVKEDREARNAIVYFTPDGGASPDAPSEPYRITMTRKSFVPRVLAVPVGSRVSFPNDDRILHNVFSLSRVNRFDLGLYRRGEAKEVVMKRPGVVQIYCNVHHSMVAYVLALETPHFTRPDGDGAFRLQDLPAGPGRLEIWHERAEPRSLDIIVPKDGSIDVRLEITKPRVPPHRNKFGKPYKRRRGKAY